MFCILRPEVAGCGDGTDSWRVTGQDHATLGAARSVQQCQPGPGTSHEAQQQYKHTHTLTNTHTQTLTHTHTQTDQAFTPRSEVHPEGSKAACLLQGCSWSVIFVDLDAHNRNRQTLCSLLPRESRSHVSLHTHTHTHTCQTFCPTHTVLKSVAKDKSLLVNSVQVLS